MDLQAAINFLTALSTGLFSYALVAGIIAGFVFLVRTYHFSNKGGARQVTAFDLALLMLSMVVLVYLPDFISDSVQTVIGTGVESSSPLSWGKAEVSSGDSVKLTATLLYRFFQVFGVICFISFGTGMQKLNNPSGRGEVTGGGLLTKLLAGVALFMPAATADGVGKIFPLVGEFGRWMSSNQL